MGSLSALIPSNARVMAWYASKTPLSRASVSGALNKSMSWGRLGCGPRATVKERTNTTSRPTAAIWTETGANKQTKMTSSAPALPIARNPARPGNSNLGNCRFGIF